MHSVLDDMASPSPPVGAVRPDLPPIGTGGTGTFTERGRRRQIVAATVTTIAELGLAQASFTRIASRAGISPALISYHFGSRRNLIEQVVTDLLADMDRKLVAEIGEAPDHLEILRRLIVAQVRYFAGHRNEVIALGEVMRDLERRAASSAPATQADVGEAGAPWRQQSVAELEQMLSAGQAAGELRDFDPRLMALTLLAALEAVPGELLLERAEPERYAAELAETFVRATRADHASGSGTEHTDA